jgi:hypothetical protein
MVRDSSQSCSLSARALVRDILYGLPHSRWFTLELNVRHVVSYRYVLRESFTLHAFSKPKV